MADTHQEKERRHLRFRHAAFGHQKQQRPDGDVYRRFGAANPVFCSAERTGEHTQAAGGRNCGGKGQRDEVWQAAASLAGQFL